MNSCNDRHDPTYKIKYKPLNPSQPSPEWYVCEKCFGLPEFFGAANEIEVISPLKNCLTINFDFKHLSLLTETVTSKIIQKLPA